MKKRARKARKKQPRRAGIPIGNEEPGLSSGEKAKLRARFRAENFYEELERLLNRYEPQRFGPIIASKIFDLVDGPREQWSYYPPHVLANLIEANCAYHRSGRDEAVTPERIRDVMNHCQSYKDPYLDYTLTGLMSLELFLLALARQQFRFQNLPTMPELARGLLLFSEGNPLPRTSRLFVDQYEFPIHDWARMSLAVNAWTKGNHQPPLTSPSSYLDSTLQFVPKEAVRPFLRMSSLSPMQIRAHYYAVREPLPPFLHTLVPSVFFEFPLVAYNNDTYLVVHPGLLFLNAQDGLYRICNDLDSELFHREFAASFTRYVGKVLGEIPDAAGVWTERDIQRESPGRACDYIVDFEDCVLLIECKSVRYSSTLPTEPAIAKDNSTAKLAEGFEQIYCTAQRIREGQLETILGSRDRPLLGFVVTYGDIYFASSPWYVSKFILPRAVLPVPGKWSSPLAWEPQVVSVGTLELIVATIKHEGLSLDDLVRMKLSRSFRETGDWAPYLNERSGGKGPPMLTFLRETADSFFETLGVSRLADQHGKQTPT